MHLLTQSSGANIIFLKQILVLKPPGDIDTLNPLNAELNSTCHLLILLGDLTFMGKCIVSILEYC
jgi:anti-anti-sigma regulatory factor